MDCRVHRGVWSPALYSTLWFFIPYQTFHCKSQETTVAATFPGY